MESPAVEASSSNSRDKVFLTIAALLIAGGLFAFYYFDPALNQLVRALILVAGIVAAIALGSRTELGRNVWDAITGSRQELRKVVWPTRQESVQTTLMIAVVVLIMSLLMWGLDSLLLFGVEQLTGRN